MLYDKQYINVAFVNPPHADWCLPQIVTFLSMQSHYNEYGKFPHKVRWMTPPYKWNEYKTLDDVYQEIKTADVILFSSYIWNAMIVDNLASYVKQQNRSTITIVGGPHIGFNNPIYDFKSKRQHLYNYIATPTTPGELFIIDFLDRLIESKRLPSPENVCFEVRSSKKQPWEFLPYSIYDQHKDILQTMATYAENNDLEKFVVLETTRGCPYKCTYCEWGGGIGTKIIKKDIDVVKQDLITLKKLGYDKIYLTDANFGAFKERDREILLFAIKNNILLTDISIVKVKNLERRKEIVDMFFETNVDFNLHIPIQTISDKAMEISKRVDLSLEDKIKLGKYIKYKAEQYKYPRPGVEMIMGMPGVTIDDFYREYELLYDLQALEDYRYIYMVLPDSESANLEYIEQHKIELVEVYSDNVDENCSFNVGNLYKNNQSYFYTISSCFSFTRQQMCEMFLMNYIAPYLISLFYSKFDGFITIEKFVRICFEVLKNVDNFDAIWSDVCDIFDPKTPPKNINMLCGKHRTTTLKEFVDQNQMLIFTDLYERIYI